jgi:hypothetical protein
MFSGIWLAAVRRVQEKSSAPQLRLACNHLQISFQKLSAAKKRVTAVFRPVKENRRKRV